MQQELLVVLVLATRGTFLNAHVRDDQSWKIGTCMRSCIVIIGRGMHYKYCWIRHVR